MDKNCPHKITKVRKCNICGEIADRKCYSVTESDWISGKNYKGYEKCLIKKCTQCQQLLKHKIIAKNTIFRVGVRKYKVTAVDKTVEYLGLYNPNNSVITIPSTVCYNNITYKVTSIAPSALKNNKILTRVTIGDNIDTIGKQAFYGCKNLKNITIFTTNLTSKSVGSQAFTKAGSSNYKKLVVSVPKSKKKAYIKLLRKSGLSSKAKIK